MHPDKWENQFALSLPNLSVQPIQQSTQESLFYLMHGRDSVQPTKAILWPPPEHCNIDVDDYVHNITQRMIKARKSRHCITISRVRNHVVLPVKNYLTVMKPLTLVYYIRIIMLIILVYSELRQSLRINNITET